MTTIQTERTWIERFAARSRTESGGGIAAILALSGRSDIISFAGGLPDPETLPGEHLADLLHDVLEAGDASTVQYAPVRGLPGVLDYVAGRLATLEGRRPDTEELLITSGCIEGIEILSKIFLERGDVALVEAPTYLGAIMGFKSYEADVVAVPMDNEGVRIDLLEAAMATQPTPKLFYTIPDYQNPMGVSLSAERRPQVLDLARRYGVLVVEDVTYRELGFYGERLPSLWSLGPDTAVQLGTFSKTFFPGVRLGWAAGPRQIIDAMVLGKQNTDQCAGAMGQRLMEEYGRRGELDRQIARAQAFYRRRSEAMMDALRRYMPVDVTWTKPRGGFVTWLTLAPGIDTDALAARAMEAAVAFVPGSVFYPDPTQGRNELRLSFSLVPENLIEEGVRRLGALITRPL